MTGWLGAFRIARRELRGGVKGFRAFLGCLALGVGAIAAVGSVGAAIEAGLAAGAREILGGDVAVRRAHRDLTPDQRRWIETTGVASRAVTLRAMARPSGRMEGKTRPSKQAAIDARPTARARVIELKAVDGRYPLYGALALDPPLEPAAAFGLRDGAWGAVVEQALMDRLDIGVGRRIRIGDADFVVRARIVSEPDRAGFGRLIGLGPRVMVSDAALPATGLIRPGSLVHYIWRVRLAAGADPIAWRRAAERAFPDAGWRLRDRTDAAPAVTRFVDRAGLFLTLVGLTALLIGGVGVGNAVANFLAGKTETIATLKCLGAPSRLIFRAYLIQVAVMAALGIAAGLVLGALVPALAGDVVAAWLPIGGGMAVHAAPLALAAGFGVLVALCFSLWPLARASAIPTGSLFRDLVAPTRQWRQGRIVAAIGVAGIALAALTVASAAQPHIAAWYVAGAAAALLTFVAAGRMAMRLARRAPRPGSPRLRLALANLHRPGAPTTGVVVSLGLGITALVAVVLIEGNLRHQIAKSMPARAPDFFFIDIQPHQVAPFEAAVRAAGPGAEIRRTPILRGRITAIAGVPVAQARVDPGVGWMVRGDRGLTWSRHMPEGTRLVAGEWWAEDYRGPPLVSLTADAARGFGVGIGDALTVNVLGRTVTARIGSIRSVRWRSLRLNFVMVFSPGVLEAAPQTHLATVRAGPGGSAAIERAVTDRFANVTAIRVREVLATVGAFLDRIGAAVRLAAGVTVLAGVLVLAGALAAGHRRRVYDAVVLKVLGATRRDVAAVYLAEYGLLGLVTAVIAGVFGTAAAWAVVTRLMRLDWVFLPEQAALAAATSAVLTVALGFIGTWRALGHKAAPLLRND